MDLLNLGTYVTVPTFLSYLIQLQLLWLFITIVL